MNEDTWNRVKQIFHGAVARPTAERDRFLAEACADDPTVRSEVEELLAAHDVVDEPQTASVVGAGRAREIEGAGATIGRYKLLQRIGEGGFGVVYMAEQEQPIRRRVALKIIKLGMDTKQVVARFEAERQAPALMDHPSIAKVLDAGATDTGRPYFVMELVKGVSITGYCDANNLSTSERLRLFVEVCHAVQHAHQKGVIHRDIKPTKVMVTLHDGTPVPKVIDFGVAKAMHQRLTEKTLGALLYELLTGTPPFDPQSLHSAAYAEIQRMLKEVEPPRPSTRLTTPGESLEAIARHRQTDPGALARLIRGDLDWIVMKALEKDRTRRYGSASDLAADIVRHFSHEPVIARPPSRSYRLWKFVAKHRGPVAAAAAVGTTIVVLGSLSMWLGWNAQRSAERTKATAVVASAAAAADPLLKAQLLLEVADRPDTPGLLSVAREAANFPLPVAVFRGHERSLTSVAFDPDSTRIVTSSRDGTARVWRIDGSAEPVVLRGGRFGVDRAVFSPDGRLVGGSSNSGVYIWRADGTGAPVLLDNDYANDGEFAFRDDSRYVVVSASDSKSAGIWRVDGTGEPVVLPGPEGIQVRRVAFSPDGSRVATGSDDWTVQVWRADGSGTPMVLRGHDDTVTTVVFSPDGSRLLTASDDGTARVWHTGAAEAAFVFRHEAGVRRAVWGAAGTMVFTVTHDNTGRSWHLDRTDETPTIGEADHFAIPADGWRGATANGNTARIHGGSLSEFVELRGHEQDVRDLAFSPDGGLLVTIGENTARLWRVDDTGESLDLAGPDAIVASAMFSPDGTRMVTGLEDGTARVRRVDGIGEPVILRGHAGAVLRATFSPDGTRVVTGSDDGTARVWLASGAGESMVLQGHDGAVHAVRFSPNGARVATASDDTTVRVWRVDGTAPPIILRGHEGPVGSVAFSPDGVLVLTLSGDGDRPGLAGRRDRRADRPGATYR